MKYTHIAYLILPIYSGQILPTYTEQIHVLQFLASIFYQNLQHSLTLHILIKQCFTKVHNLHITYCGQITNLNFSNFLVPMQFVPLRQFVTNIYKISILLFWIKIQFTTKTSKILYILVQLYTRESILLYRIGPQKLLTTSNNQIQYLQSFIMLSTHPPKKFCFTQNQVQQATISKKQLPKETDIDLDIAIYRF
eukprot:TRINITY_DN7112_c0_g1_i1.p2 TRINITY_DN7112_c0_g1~~TRINITY_DN7112_c0_g1_i1.p2  ORF type:complete len:194 (+),score=-18.93 TRINITY_DN7112_c0_g1_i1:209-790(+)